MMRAVIAVGVLTLRLCVPSSVYAQTLPAPAAADAVQDAAAPSERGGAARFVRDVGGDYKHFLSWSTAKWLGVGTIATAAIHPADDEIRDATQGEQVGILSETAGQTYGNLSLQLPLALSWWIAGHAAGGTRAAEAGRDLVRAQISALSWTYVVKYAVDRTRPNGDPRGFPSGHASAAFATAMVLQEHYGWKLGVPFFAIATYTGASRIIDNKHWASDVVMGAFLGMASGRTVTVHVRSRPVAISPLAVPGGGGVTVSVQGIE
jgi:PAP2 superfamily